MSRQMLDVVLPPQCGVCRTLVDRHGDLCPDCWGKVQFINGPLCACCSIPFDFDLGDGSLCGRCAAGHPPYDRARAVLRYDDASRSMLLVFKHGDRLDLARPFTRWMARAGGRLLAECDVVVPVPLHWTRLLRRRFNQSAELARHLARQAGRAYAPEVVRRIRPTPPQGLKTRLQRAENVRGAFMVPAPQKSRLAESRVLLVDDVMTTGATAESLARCLKQAGAARVDILTLARVVLPA